MYSQIFTILTKYEFKKIPSFALKDFGINKDLGPLSTNVEMLLSIEGIRL